MNSGTAYSFDYILDDYRSEYEKWTYYSHVQGLDRKVLHDEMIHPATPQERIQDIQKILHEKDFALLRGQEASRKCEAIRQNLSAVMAQIDGIRGSTSVVAGEMDSALKQVPRMALDLSEQYEHVSNYTLNTRVRQMCKIVTPMNEDGEPLATTQRWVIGPVGHTIDIMGREVQALVEVMATVTDLFVDAEIRESIHSWLDEWYDREDELGMLAFALSRFLPHRGDFDDPDLEHAPAGTLLSTATSGKKDVDLQKSLDRFLEKINQKSVSQGKSIRVMPCLMKRTNIWAALKQYEHACGMSRFATHREVKMYKTTETYEIHLSALPRNLSKSMVVERVKRYIRDSVLLKCDTEFLNVFHEHKDTLPPCWPEFQCVACILSRYMVVPFDPERQLPDLLVHSLKPVISWDEVDNKQVVMEDADNDEPFCDDE